MKSNKMLWLIVKVLVYYFELMNLKSVGPAVSCMVLKSKRLAFFSLSQNQDPKAH